MSIDFSKIPQSKKKRLIELGKHFGSQDTLDQANQTLAACASHGAELAGYGVGPKQIQDLKDLRDALLEAGVGREEAKGLKKVNGLGYIDAMNKAETARLTCQSVLSAAAEDLEGTEDALELEGLKGALSALAQTKKAADEAEPMVQQLSLLVGALKHTAIVGATKDTGGAAALAKAEGAILALRKADEEASGARGTPVETQALDLVDGMIVQLARRFRRAAGAAARDTGQEALKAVFRLDRLYGHRAAEPSGEAGTGEVDEAKPG